MHLSGMTYSLTHGAYAADIASVGASVRTLTHDGRDLVRPFDADQLRPAFSGALLAPWPNRIVDGRYTWDGVEHQLALTEPARGHALHGLVLWTDFTAMEHSNEHLLLLAEIPAQEGYPFPVLVEVEHRLSDDGLATTVVATNLGDIDAPWGTGPHPYLVAGAGSVDDWTLRLPAETVIDVTEPRLIPAQARSVAAGPLDFRSARPVEETFIDHAFTDLMRDDDGWVSVEVTKDGTGAGIRWDSASPWVQIHTADALGRTALAVEPMTCPPNAFASGTDVIRLSPDVPVATRWTIYAV